MPSPKLLEAVAVTAELCGRTFTEPAARMFVADLEGYDEAMLFGALQRCRREVRGMLTVQDVISRLDDGRPGPEEAWAMMPRDEAKTVVWTEEMAQAWGTALPLLEQGEEVPARMAFKEVYTRLLHEARANRIMPKWTASLGHDKEGREVVLLEAMRLGRLSAPHVAGLLPYHQASAQAIAMIENELAKVKQLPRAA